MEDGNLLENGLSGPLLGKKNSSSNLEDERQAADYQDPRRKPSNWKAPAIVLGFSFLESIAFNGVGANLVLYLGTILHGSNSSNAANVSSWGGTSYLTPLLGGLLADSYWGNYRTIFVSIILYLIGMIIVTFSAAAPFLKPAPCEGSICPPATGGQKLVFFSGLYLIAFGTGGTRSALLPLGADQFDNENPVEREKKWSFFSWFYLCAMLGVLISGTLIVWAQENMSWALGFGIATFCMALASGAFLIGTPTYYLRMPKGSPLKSVIQVLVASLRKMHLKVPLDETHLYEINDKDSGNQRLAHTKGFRFLDKAAIISDTHTTNGNTFDSWSLCTITQVEEFKILLRFLPIWATSVIYSAACTQMNSTFIQQGSAMNNKISSFSIPPASLSSFGVICVVVWALLYKKIIAPVCMRCIGNGKIGLTQLQRMGIGRFMMILAMATAGYVESRRLESVKAGEVLSICWQFPQYFIISGSEVFSYITQLEFFYGQAPESMRCICNAFALLSTAFGNYLSSFVITLVATLTESGGTPGWVPDDLNKGHLDYYFYSLAGVCALNFLVYIVIANKFTLKKILLTNEFANHTS